MEFLSLVGSSDLNRIIRCECFVINRSPSIVFNALVPSLIIAIVSLVITHINFIFSFVSLDLHVVAWRKCIDVDDAAVREDLVVDEWGELLATETESNVAARGSVEKCRFTSIDTPEQLHRIAFLLEVDKVLVIPENLHIRESTPCLLYPLCRDLILTLLHLFLLALEESPPRPLYLNGRYVVHSKSVVFEKASGQGHFIRRLNQCGAEVTKTVFLTSSHDVEGRG